ncbi:hypothetical protein CPC16_000328 [Podila verticillata]|nr:hypothetical protein CPC16_000328 [Podila verticillata]
MKAPLPRHICSYAFVLVAVLTLSGVLADSKAQLEGIPKKNSVHKPRDPIPGYIAAIASPEAFCFLLPPDPKVETVAVAEDHAVAFCTQPNVAGATGAKVFPANFIVSAHYQKNITAGWVQTTGLLNPEVYGMSMTDDGGQYDVKAPMGASCAGYTSFVNLIEPSSSRYCIRCCMNPLDCNVKISERGCRRIVPGYYGLGGSVQGTLMYPATAELSAEDLRTVKEQLAQSSSDVISHDVTAEDAPKSSIKNKAVPEQKMMTASALEEGVQVVSFTPVTSDATPRSVRKDSLELGGIVRRLALLGVVVVACV